MKQNVAVLSKICAEYGPLYRLIKGIQINNDLSLQVIVGARHWFPEFCETWQKVKTNIGPFCILPMIWRYRNDSPRP